MKKPQCKDTPTASTCQAFYRQYMLSSSDVVAKKCFRTQNFIQYKQKLLILTLIKGLSFPQPVANGFLLNTQNRQTNRFFRTIMLLFISVFSVKSYICMF